MPRPKKPPRVRLQIVFERDQAKRLRSFCKDQDCEISSLVRRAVEVELSFRADAIRRATMSRAG